MIKKCTRCAWHLNEFGINCTGFFGNPDADIIFCGEAFGREEALEGKAFVGKAGKYLDKWLTSIELSRNRNCYIGNVVKCRPPGNRDPQPEEWRACLPYLEKQVEYLRPKAILTLGRISSQIITQNESGIGALRGRIYSYKSIS